MSGANRIPDESDETAQDEDSAPVQDDQTEAQAVETVDYAHSDTPEDRAGDFADELDGLRIRQLAVLRRGAIRSRSYVLIAVGACFVGAVKLGLLASAHVRERGWGAWPIGYLLFAIAALMIGGYFARRAAELRREINTPVPLPPPPPGGPDFSTLSDGSQQWKNLEKIR